ncbi:MAG: DUF4336 domain-containing protein [Kofleriaceae bacterium]|nr:DUF4336 domain-containing protein [Kofleriaceae bacterium]
MRTVAPGIWHIPYAPVKLFGGVRMPISSTVFRLPDRTLLLYSPGDIDDIQAKELAVLGDVSHIVAPSLLHHLYVGHAAQRWPQAKLHAAPGLAAKRPDIKFHRELGRDPDPAWGDAIDVEVVAGTPSFNEAVLFHRPSGTLSVADFVFNVTKPANFATRFVLAMTGTGGRELRQSRLWRFAVKDRAAARGSIDRILAWPIQHVLPVHGEAIDIDASRLAARLGRSYGAMPVVQLPAGTLPMQPLGQSPRHDEAR